MMPALHMAMLLRLLVIDYEVATCAPGQNACVVQQLSLTPVMDDALRVGCAALTTCNLLPSDTAARLSGSSFCCTTDLCTNGSYIRDPGPAWRLPCQSCVGSASTCGPDTPTLTCPGRQAQCLQLSRRLLPGKAWTPGNLLQEEGERFWVPCGWWGPSEELLALATGPDLAYVDVHVQRCHSVGCNNSSFAEVPRGKPNGKLCYSCRDTGAGECERQELQSTGGTGTVDQCAQAQSTGENHPPHAHGEPRGPGSHPPDHPVLQGTQTTALPRSLPPQTGTTLWPCAVACTSPLGAPLQSAEGIMAGGISGNMADL
ncbi:urokinase plasminogen activator surface receptor-like [Alligator sinensis]|uniref:Urokinase plasminogen activator surface receptor-like n=1 Tax=Alligator sinensis TaxID=38654 RepID=A0A3Q0FR94_ALLSI|nr:urokinase plasminogen activator surface receptor-like [Alligator sinensis]